MILADLRAWLEARSVTPINWPLFWAAFLGTTFFWFVVQCAILLGDSITMIE